VITAHAIGLIDVCIVTVTWALALETGGGDYLAVLLDVELDPSLYDLVTLLINLPGNPIDARPVERSAWTALSPDLSMRFFFAYFSIQAATPSQWYSTTVHAIGHIDACTATASWNNSRGCRGRGVPLLSCSLSERLILTLNTSALWSEKLHIRAHLLLELAGGAFRKCTKVRTTFSNLERHRAIWLSLASSLDISLSDHLLTHDG